jgi:hypothetical protein
MFHITIGFLDSMHWDGLGNNNLEAGEEFWSTAAGDGDRDMIEAHAVGIVVHGDAEDHIGPGTGFQRGGSLHEGKFFFPLNR